MRITKLLPFTRTTTAWWAWRNRDALIDWVGFSSRALRQVRQGNTEDTATEARLRLSLTRDSRTRSAARALDVQVRGGVAELRGRVPRDVAHRAIELAEDAKGVRRVRDHLDVVRARGGSRGGLFGRR